MAYADQKALTIVPDAASRLDPQALALAALGWIVGDSERGNRLLALTGLSPGDLKHGLDDPAVLAAVLDFLLGYEADLLAAADALGVAPQAIVTARAELPA